MMRIRALSLTFVFMLVSTCISGPAMASGLPQVDIAALTKKIMENIQSSGLGSQMLGIVTANIRHAAGLGSLETDSENNEMANSVARRGQAEQDIQNLKMAEMAAPDTDACATITLSSMDGLATKKIKNYGEGRAAAANYYRQKSVEAILGEGHSSKARDRYPDRVAILDRQAARDAKAKEGNDGDSGAAQGSALIFSPGASLTGDPAQELMDFVDLVAPVYMPSHTDFVELDSQKSEFVQRRLRVGAFQNLANASLTAISAEKLSPGGSAPSRDYVLGAQADAFFIGSGSIVARAGTGSAPISEVLRSVATAKAFQIHLDLLQYRQALREEALAAAHLARRIK